MATRWRKLSTWIVEKTCIIFCLVTLVVLGFLASCAKKESPPPPAPPVAKDGSEGATPEYEKDGQGAPALQPAPSPSPATFDTLPPFFPPKATSTEDLNSRLKEIYTAYRTVQGKGPSMRQLDGDLSAVLEEAGYEKVSHYWLAGQDNPGFAVATHIEFIDDLGRPVMNHRFETSLPTPTWFSGWDFLKALALPRNGRYRLIAVVVAQKPLAEKPNEITHEQVEEINHGPNGLSGRDWADLEVTPRYNFTAYIYEFYRKSRSEPITVLSDSDIPASKHLVSIDFVQNLSGRMRSLPRP
jgi:hypothetical protein